MILTARAPTPRRSVGGAARAAVLLLLFVSAAPVPPGLDEEWAWPIDPPRIVTGFVAPAHRYGPGHRGIDLAAGADGAVKAPASGVIAFAGDVAGRAVLTIDHGGGLVTTFEPVTTELAPGDRVRRGQPIALVALGGHASPGTVHFGVRRDGEYINPLSLLGRIPRAVLLPCCGATPAQPRTRTSFR